MKKEESDKKFKYIVILVFVLLILMSVVLWGAMCATNELLQNTTITLNGKTSKKLAVKISDFYPGKSAEYTINLSGDDPENYTVTLNFCGDNGGLLKNYIDVTVKTDQTTVERPLRELLDGDKIFLGTNADEIVIICAMPEEAGNEAQGTSVKFYIELIATPKSKS